MKGDVAVAASRAGWSRWPKARALASVSRICVPRAESGKGGANFSAPGAPVPLPLHGMCPGFREPGRMSSSAPGPVLLAGTEAGQELTALAPSILVVPGGPDAEIVLTVEDHTIFGLLKDLDHRFRGDRPTDLSGGDLRTGGPGHRGRLGDHFGRCRRRRGDYLSLRQARDRLSDRLGGLEATQVSDMPLTGTATYKGVAGFAAGRQLADEGVDMLGEMALEADFATGSIGGDVDRFCGPGGEEFARTRLSIDDGPIARNGFTARGSGTFGNGDQLGRIEDLRIIGGFSGAGADLTSGVAAGTATMPDGSGIGIEGTFAGSR